MVARRFSGTPSSTYRAWPVYGSVGSGVAASAVAGRSGIYEVDVDFDESSVWLIFEGNDEPTNWDLWWEFLGDTAQTSSVKEILNILRSGEITQVSPITSSGKFSGPIVIGDDYLDERAFVWYIDPEPNPIDEYRVLFGGKSFQAGKWLVEGDISPITIDSQPKWKLTHQFPSASSSNMKAGTYAYAVTLIHNNTKRITKTYGTVDAVNVFTSPIPPLP